MVTVPFSIQEDYWENFELQDDDIEFLYNNLLEAETPLTSQELVAALVEERIRRERLALEQQRTAGGDLYQPKGSYTDDQRLIFPALNWRRGRVAGVRPGKNPDLGAFQVIQVAFEDGEQREFASGLENHRLNEPQEVFQEEGSFDLKGILEAYSEILVESLEQDLETSPDFVRIAGRWFPQALLVGINVGHLNLAEAVLDMGGGGPLPTAALLEQIELSSDANPRLLEFSMDHALQEDPRFDEVGAAGDVLWFLRRLEPPEVLEPPVYLRYAGSEYDRSVLTKDMLALEKELDDELSPVESRSQHLNEGEVHLIFPHWRSGTLPLTARIRHLFPTAFESPRIRFMLVDGDTGEHIPGWVVREKRYVYGLKNWYAQRGLMPGSIIRVQRGSQPGEVILRTENRRSTREWIRTVLVGSDGGVVFAMLKQIVSATFEERMAIAVPDVEALEPVWQQTPRDQASFERVVGNMVRELAKLNPQSHVHASELYAAVNVVRRCPPGPILALLATRPGFAHVGDLHYRITEAE